MRTTLVLLAAGMGSRYGGLKQLEKLGPSGETLMDYSIYDAIRSGFNRVVFVIRRDIERDFEAIIGSKYRNVVEVDYAFQSLDDLPSSFEVPAGREKPWGTGQALYAARRIIDEPFGVINADDFYGADSFAQLHNFLANPPAGKLIPGCMCGYLMRNTLSENGSVARGICSVDADGNLAKVVEHTQIYRRSDGVVVSQLANDEQMVVDENVLVSMNCWGFSPAVFGELERLFAVFLTKSGNELKSEFYIPAMADTLITERIMSVKMLTSNSKWFGMTYKEDKETVVAGLNELIAAGAYPKKLF